MLIMWFGACDDLLKIWIKVTFFFNVIGHQKGVTIIPLNHMKINTKMEMKDFICVSTILYPSLHLHST